MQKSSLILEASFSHTVMISQIEVLSKLSSRGNILHISFQTVQCIILATDICTYPASAIDLFYRCVKLYLYEQAHNYFIRLQTVRMIYLTGTDMENVVLQRKRGLLFKGQYIL